MIHEIWLFLGKTGLPLWSKQFSRVKHSLDPALVAGLLTAIKGFSDQAIGSELKDLVLESDKLHNYLVSDEILFTIHIDNKVDPKDKLDKMLSAVSQKLNSTLNNLTIPNLDTASFKEFQKLIQNFTPILETFVIELVELRKDLIIIHDEKSFDSHQLILLSKVPELVPFLTKHQISIQIKDLKTNKIHFQQITTEFENSSEINEIMDYLENQDYFLKDLETNPCQIYIGNTVTSAFKIPQDKNNIFILSKENVTVNDLPSFRKCIIELKSKILEFF